MQSRSPTPSFYLLVLVPLVLGFGNPVLAENRTARAIELDRVVYAVDGAESSHGRDPKMWRSNPIAPQGPMQVSEKAAQDVGGGDRFDIAQNRAIGRAYLALLYRRYGNWPDAVSAYNWGRGNLDNWIKAGRPAQKLLPAVAAYLARVIREAGMCSPQNGTRDCFADFYRLDADEMRLENLVLPVLKQSGRPRPILAGSGLPLLIFQQSGRPLPTLEQSGRTLRSHRSRS
jgi:transglycosylase-like protein with SLT domain